MGKRVDSIALHSEYMGVQCRGSKACNQSNISHVFSIFTLGNRLLNIRFIFNKSNKLKCTYASLFMEKITLDGIRRIYWVQCPVLSGGL